MAKRQKKLQAFVVPPPPDFKVVFLQACWKNIDAGGRGGGGPEKGIFISNDSFATIYGKGCLNSQKKKFEQGSPVHENLQIW